MQNIPDGRPGRFVVIADDFTGAMDTGVHFLTPQSRPLVRIVNGTPLRPTHASDDHVLVVDTETRPLGPGEAYDRVRAVASELAAEGYLRFYKKIDSTYRGNVGAELDALLDLHDYPAAAVVSAVPKAGRTVRDGICLVRGIPLHESEFGADRLSPRVTSSTLEIVASQSTRKSVVIGRNPASHDPVEFAAELERHIGLGAEILLIDATSDGDIRRIVKALRLLPVPLLLVGAAGLAEALAETGSTAYTDNSSPAGADTGPGSVGLLGEGPALFVSGSLMRTTAEQADRLASYTDRVGCITLQANAMVNALSGEMNRIVESAVALARSGRHVLLRTSDGRPVSEHPWPELAQPDAGRIARFIGTCARRIVESSLVDTLILSGGSTAVAVMEELGVADLRIVAEAESGLPVCDAEIPNIGRHYRIVTKAGGFGRVDSYERIMERMDRHATNHSYHHG
ncbi:MAG: four-carbon acid sugar kinase family protein [Spirochaetia bacterium]